MAQTPVQKLFLHIGLHKTGTSAIQYALYHARERLKEQGVLYPASVAWNDFSHHSLTLPFWREEDYAPAFKDLRAEIEESGCQTLVISSELFPNIYEQADRWPAFWAEVQALADDIEIILYARRQDRLAESVFKQWAKSDDLKLSIPPADFIKDDVRINMDILHYCQVWAGMPGVSKLHLRSYDKCRSVLLPSFLDILGLPANITDGYNSVHANPTLDGEKLMFRHYFNGYDLPQAISDQLLAYIQKHLSSEPRLDVFTLEEKRALLARYADSNREAFKTFGNDDTPFDDEFEASGHAFRRPTTPEVLDFFMKLSQVDKRLAAHLFDAVMTPPAPAAPV
ncbi:hypothetical protein [Kordiimonas marina]|uniref:hypothetical protein n=1 Tax=Kordiimonas marina TaxID=2872312 RepID=UPI001FF5098C|nr:hypothetical protein [Kordiimonas marina]MCJ9429761.1 hypothetical protein [Kordiimonas marina]